jgi:hypothetical protein
MRTKTRLCAALGLVLLGCAVPPAPPPLQPAAEMQQRGVRTIALAPLRVDGGIAEPVRARSELEPRVTARLVAAGFTVVPSAELDGLWKSAAGEVGAVYDPVTGEVDRERFDAVQASVLHDLRVRHHADAVLHIAVVRVSFYLPDATLWFYGTKDLLYWPRQEGGLSGFDRATYATVSCLDLRLTDLDERELFTDRGGLETIETYARQTHAERPLDERMRDPKRLEQAVDYAMTALTGPAVPR